MVWLRCYLTICKFRQVRWQSRCCQKNQRPVPLLGIDRSNIFVKYWPYLHSACSLMHCSFSNTSEHIHLFAACERYPRSSAFTHVGDQSWARAVCSSESIPSHSCLSICPPVWGRSWWCERRPHFAPAPNIPCSADMTKMISYLTRLVSWMLVIWQVTQGSREREVCLQMLPPCWILIHCNALLVLAQRIPWVWCWSFQLLEH